MCCFYPKKVILDFIRLTFFGETTNVKPTRGAQRCLVGHSFSFGILYSPHPQPLPLGGEGAFLEARKEAIGAKIKRILFFLERNFVVPEKFEFSFERQSLKQRKKAN